MDRVKPVIIQRVTSSLVVVHESLFLPFSCLLSSPLATHFFSISRNPSTTLVHIIVSTYIGVAKQEFSRTLFQFTLASKPVFISFAEINKRVRTFLSLSFFFFSFDTLIIGKKKQLVSDVN